jgi:hypothetical protein
MHHHDGTVAGLGEELVLGGKPHAVVLEALLHAVVIRQLAALGAVVLLAWRVRNHALSAPHRRRSRR